MLIFEQLSLNRKHKANTYRATEQGKGPVLFNETRFKGPLRKKNPYRIRSGKLMYKQSLTAPGRIKFGVIFLNSIYFNHLDEF